MIARLWWKEARQVGPIWVFLAGLGLIWLGLVRWFAGVEPNPGVSLASLTALIPFVYMFLIGAAIFAGERENRTLEWLDALPVERWRLWMAKASFAAASTAALGLLLALFAAALFAASLARLPGGAGLGHGALLVGFFALAGFGWSLFWSALLSNALLAAALGLLSLTATLVQLNPKGALTSGDKPLTAWHWLFAVALVAASAAILHLGGLRRRRRSRLIKTTDDNIITPRSNLIWPASAPRLVWRELRAAWPVWWPLLALGFAVFAALARYQGFIDAAVSIFGAILAGLILGANAFNAENRGGTQRFLVAHGARPGVVWLAKLGVGLALVAPVVFVWSAPSYWGLGNISGAPEGWSSLEIQSIMIGSSTANAFAAGVLCGMAFRRGITAALVSFILWLVVCAPPYILLVSRVLWPTHLFWVPVAILAVSWAWSGDWLLDRPGVGRWVRLGLYSTAAVVALASAYIANRVWSAPAIPADQRNGIFQFDRIAAAIPDDENAANLYREVAAAGITQPTIESMKQGIWTLPSADWDESSPDLLAWLDRNAANLETLRKAAALPACRFHDLRTMTTFTARNEKPRLRFFDLALAASARVRFARGDARGAWEDIEALIRMGRQFSGLNIESVRGFGEQAERIGLEMAIRWANNPSLTADLLKTARDSYRATPPPAGPADLARVDALLFHNTAERLSRAEVIQGLTGQMSRPPDLSEALSFALMTTPWELARLRRVLDLLAAEQIQAVDYVERRRPELPLDAFLSSSNLRRLESMTPLIKLGIAPPSAGDRSRVVNLYGPMLDVILSLRCWQAEHGGRLPETLDELAEADPEVAPSLIDPFARIDLSAWFNYAPSDGRIMKTLEPLRPDSLAQRADRHATNGYMLISNDGPSARRDGARTPGGFIGVGDIVFPIRDDVPPPE